jgi:hypothetical protein
MPGPIVEARIPAAVRHLGGREFVPLARLLIAKNADALFSQIDALVAMRQSQL